MEPRWPGIHHDDWAAADSDIMIIMMLLCSKSGSRPGPKRTLLSLVTDSEAGIVTATEPPKPIEKVNLSRRVKVKWSGFIICPRLLV